jgi:hypothetical protein
MHIKAKCRCGNIALALDWPAEASEIPARACTCTFCVKHGGVWTSHPAASLVATIQDPTLVSPYLFGTRTATFHVCSRCGAVPLVTSEIGGHVYAVVNVNMFEDAERLPLRPSVARFDGEAEEARLERRSRNWIGRVRLLGAGT